MLDGKSNISAFSYLAVQLFEHSHNGSFKSTTEATSLLQTANFALLPSIQALVAVKAPVMHDEGKSQQATLSHDDYRIFKDLRSCSTQIATAIAAFKRRKRKSDDAE